jgi:hypothetical protein
MDGREVAVVRSTAQVHRWITGRTEWFEVAHNVVAGDVVAAAAAAAAVAAVAVAVVGTVALAATVTALEDALAAAAAGDNAGKADSDSFANDPAWFHRTWDHLNFAD